uniref:Ig-like domain-containing protein n=1 Tax=Equus asinus asinus TaxID=83772 RepID=A0A8C4L2Y8_EQUAS
MFSHLHPPPIPHFPSPPFPFPTFLYWKSHSCPFVHVHFPHPQNLEKLRKAEPFCETFDVHLFPRSSSIWSSPCPGSHSLLYDLTVVSQDGSVQSRLFAEGHLHGQTFLHYDSEKGRAEPQGLWAIAVLGTNMWDIETKGLADKRKDLRETLEETMALQDQKGDSHSLQEIRGCEIQEDNSARGLWHFCYDGELFLSYNPKTNEWTVAKSSAQTQAIEIKKSWEADGFQSQDYRARVQGELCGRLRRYQKSWMGFMDRAVPPAVNVTHTQASGGMVTLTCWAFGFSPRNISVTWRQAEEPLSQDAQQSGGVLPDGNGTYQTWVAIRIPQEEEQRFRCHVEHSGNHTAHPVLSGEPGVLLEGVLTLVESGAWVGEKREGLWLSCAQVVIRLFFRKGCGAADCMASHSGSCSWYCHDCVCPMLQKEEDNTSCREHRALACNLNTRWRQRT